MSHFLHFFEYLIFLFILKIFSVHSDIVVFYNKEIIFSVNICELQ